MAVPFRIPDEDGDTPASSMPQNYHDNMNNSHLPRVPQIDYEALVQAFYEALWRNSYAQSSAPISPLLTSFPSDHWNSHSNASSTFSSVASSPRNSFRERQRADLSSDNTDNQSITSDSEIYQHDVEYFSTDDQRQNIRHARKAKKAHKNSKLRNLVINTLQFIIDTLK